MTDPALTVARTPPIRPLRGRHTLGVRNARQADAGPVADGSAGHQATGQHLSAVDPPHRPRTVIDVGLHGAGPSSPLRLDPVVERVVHALQAIVRAAMDGDRGRTAGQLEAAISPGSASARGRTRFEGADRDADLDVDALRAESW